MKRGGLVGFPLLVILSSMLVWMAEERGVEGFPRVRRQHSPGTRRICGYRLVEELKAMCRNNFPTHNANGRFGRSVMSRPGQDQIVLKCCQGACTQNDLAAYCGAPPRMHPDVPSPPIFHIGQMSDPELYHGLDEFELDTIGGTFDFRKGGFIGDPDYQGRRFPNFFPVTPFAINQKQTRIRSNMNSEEEEGQVQEEELVQLVPQVQADEGARDGTGGGSGGYGLNILVPKHPVSSASQHAPPPPAVDDKGCRVAEKAVPTVHVLDTE